MTRRERVLTTLDRKRADRIPSDIGGTYGSSIHVLTYKKLRAHLGLAEKPSRCACLMQLITELDDDVRDALGVDTQPLFFRSRETKVWKAPFGVDVIVPIKFGVEDLPDGSSVVKNPQGTVTARRAASAFYFDPVGIPLAEVTTPEELDGFDDLFGRWDYSYVYDEPIQALAERARRQYQSTDKAVIASWNLHYLQSGQLMRGYEQFFIDLIMNKDLVQAILGKLHEVYLERIDTFLDAFADSIDIVFLTDDLGTQRAGLISPAMYKEIFFPYMAEVVARIKSAGKKVIMHSCGAVAEFIPFFIEMGVDALNPVQVSAQGMNPAHLVREFGQDIAFWGGGCDTQHALNAPDPETVRADVRRRLREFGPDASLVFTQVHNIQYDVSPENILALRDEFQKQTRNS